MPPSKEEMVSKQNDTFQPGVSQRGNKQINGITILSSQTLLFIVLLNLIIGASFFMSIRSEVIQSQIQQHLLSLSEQVQSLNDQIKQKQNITEFTQLKDRFETLSASIEKSSLLVEKPILVYDSLESKIASAIELKYDSLNKKVEVMKEELSEVKIKAANSIEKSSFFVEKYNIIQAIDVKYDALNSKVEIFKDVLNSKVEIIKEQLSEMKIIAANSIEKSSFFVEKANIIKEIDVKYDAFNGKVDIFKDVLNSKVEIIKEELSEMKIKATTFADMREFLEYKTQVDLAKQGIDSIQKSLDPALIQISQLSSINNEISNLKKEALDLKFSLNEHLKQANITSTTSGSNSSTTNPTSPDTASNSSSTDDSEYQTQIYGPYLSPLYSQSQAPTSTEFAIFDTTTSCILLIKKRAIVTLIANGLGICNSCQGIMTFLINKQVKLKLTNYYNFYSGAQNLYTEWDPISLTQEFIVEAGTYEFTLGFASIRSGASFSVEGLSFVAKVSYE